MCSGRQPKREKVMNRLPMTDTQVLRRFRLQNELDMLPRQLRGAELRLVFKAEAANGKTDLWLQDDVDGLEMRILHTRAAIDLFNRWDSHPNDGRPSIQYRSSIKDDVHRFDYESGYEGYAPVKSASIGVEVDKKGKVTTNNRWNHNPKLKTAKAEFKPSHVLFIAKDDDEDVDETTLIDDFSRDDAQLFINYNGSAEQFFTANPHVTSNVSENDIKLLERLKDDREFDKYCEELSNRLEGKLEHLETTKVERIMLTNGGILNESQKDNWL